MRERSGLGLVDPRTPVAQVVRLHAERKTRRKAYLHLRTIWCVMVAPLPKGHEDRIALELLNQEPPLDLQVLEAIMGERKRYSELKHLLKGRREFVLTKALRRLQDRGAIQPGLAPDLKTKTYGLTSLGKLIIFRVHEFKPIHRSIQAYKESQAA